MTWDGTKRRATDNGAESLRVIMARIEANVNNLHENGISITKKIETFEERFREALEEHKKDDDTKFAEVNKTIYRAGGIMAGALSVIVFIINLIFKK